MGNSLNEKADDKDGVKSLPRIRARIVEAGELQFPMHQNPQLGQEQNEQKQKGGAKSQKEEEEKSEKEEEKEEEEKEEEEKEDEEK